MPIKMKQMPETERPYEKLEQYGEKALSNAELLAIIIKTGTKEETSVQLAQRLLSLNDTEEENLKFLQRLTIKELMEQKGIGKVKAIQLKAVGEIAKRMFRTSNYNKKVINESQELAKMLMSSMCYKKEEVVKVVILNAKNEIVKMKDVARGGIDYTNIPMKDILSEPIQMKEPKFILVHNHPSGDSTPSKADIIYTNGLFEIANKLGLIMVDHIIIGNMNYVGMFTTEGRIEL